MRIHSRIAAHALIIAYILLSIDAFAYTMSHRHIGIYPWAITRYFYAMMAPYQGYKRWNSDLVAEGLRSDGVWEIIDVLPYYPSYSRGQRNVRFGLVSVHWKAERTNDPDLVDRQYLKLAQQLKNHEAERGRPYDAVRLSLDEWPESPDGYEALRLPAFTSRSVLAQTP